MVPSAPRYDSRIVDAVRAFDDPRGSIAEVCRRVGEEATRLGLPRPSYVHIRRIVHAERERRRAEQEEARLRRDIAEDALADLLAGRGIDPYVLEQRIDRERARRRA
jgi:hypothetical protein